MKNLVVLKVVCFCLLIGGVQTIYSQNINRPNIKCPGDVYVNSYNGNMHLQRNDLFIKGRKLSFDMTFFYNSSSFNENHGFGNGWSFQYFMKYIPDSSGIYIVHADGRKDYYAMDSVNNNLLTPPIGIFDSLSEYESGKFVLIAKNRMKYFFDNADHKRLTMITEPNGNLLDFSYTDSLMTQISDGAGRALQLSYSSGNLALITDTLDLPTRTIQYAYDNYGNLTEVKDPAGNKRKYKYLINGPMNVVIDKNNNVVDVIYQSNFAVQEVISCITNMRFSYNSSSNTTYLVEAFENGNQVTTYQYNIDGYLKKQIGNCCGFNVSFEYDTKYNISSFTDANGNKYEYTYDTRGNMLSVKDPMGNFVFYTYDSVFNKVTSFIDKNGNSFSYVYNNEGNLTLISLPNNIYNSFTFSHNGDTTSSTDGNGNLISYIYDNYGNLIAKTKPLGAIETYTYDERSRKLSYTNPLNHTTSYSHDQLDRTTLITDAFNHTTSYTYDANGNTLTKTDALNRTYSYAFDASDRVVSITNPLGNRKEYLYNSKGNPLSIKDEGGGITTLTYDNLNRLVTRTNAANETTSYGWNGINNTSIHYPNGNVESYTFDALNQLISKIDSKGMLHSFSYDNSGNKLTDTDGNGNALTYTYDSMNRNIYFRDADGNLTTFSYDANSNLITTQDKNYRLISYAYDSLNRNINKTDELNNVTNFSYDLADNLINITDANNHSSIFTYDMVNRKTSELYANGTSKIYSYDAIGNKISKTDGNGSITYYEYDVLNRLILRDFPGTNDDIYTYSNVGKMQSASNSNSIISFTYDSANRLISETLNGKTTGYIYDIAGKKRIVFYPGGRLITEQYDERARLIRILDGDLVMAEFEYDIANRKTNSSYVNGTITSFTYDAVNRTVSILCNPEGIQSFDYMYDNEVNKLYQKNNHNPAKSEQYQYDEAYRLTSYKAGIMTGGIIPIPTAQFQYIYDNLGNRTLMNEDGSITTYTSNNVNQYISIAGIDTITPAYDLNGNTTENGVYNLSYNSENQLVSVNSGIISEYKYDALGRRIQKSLPTQIINYYYAGPHVIEERGISDTLIASYVYGNRIDDILSMERNSNKYFYHKNDLGSITAISNLSGEVVERYDYDAFGLPFIYNNLDSIIFNSAIGNPFMFTGREYNSEISSYYYRARIYDFNTGKFLQKDPLGYIDGMNLYAYVSNNPINYIDPSGTDRCSKLCDVIFAYSCFTIELIIATAGAAANPTIAIFAILNPQTVIAGMTVSCGLIPFILCDEVNCPPPPPPLKLPDSKYCPPNSICSCPPPDRTLPKRTPPCIGCFTPDGY